MREYYIGSPQDCLLHELSLGALGEKRENLAHFSIVVPARVCIY